MRHSHHILAIVLVLSIGCILPLAHASPVGRTPNSNCVFVGYAFDDNSNAYTLFENNSLLLGNYYFFESTCPHVVQINGVQNIPSNNSTFNAVEGYLTITVTMDNTTWSISNMTSYPNTPSFLDFINEKEYEYVLRSEIPSIFWAETISNLSTIVIVFFLSTGIVASKARRDSQEQISVVV